MKNLIKICSFLLVFISTNTQAQHVSEIVEKAIQASFYQGENFKAKVHMVITDKKGRIRERDMTILRKDDSEKMGSQKYYVYFTKPADVKKMTFLTCKNPDRGDNRWLYLPSMDLIKRISIGDERTSFIGSHFCYEDVSGRNHDEDVHHIEDQEETHYIIKSIPKNPHKVEFTYMKNWIDKKTFLPVKTAYFDAQDKVIKKYTVLQVAEINGFPTVLKSQMEDLQTGGKTVLSFDKVEYNLNLPDNVFTERFLRRPPLKLLL